MQNKNMQVPTEAGIITSIINEKLNLQSTESTVIFRVIYNYTASR